MHAATDMHLLMAPTGRLDYGELRACLSSLGIDATQGEAASVLAAYDANGGGLMEIEEFARLVHRLGYIVA